MVSQTASAAEFTDKRPSQRLRKSSARKAKRKSSPAVVAGMAVSLAVHVVAGIYIVMSQFVLAPVVDFTEDAVVVEMLVPQVTPSKTQPVPASAPTADSPPPRLIQPRIVVNPMASAVAPLPMAPALQTESVALGTAPAPPSGAPASPVAPADSFSGVDVDMALSQNPSPAYPPKALMAREQGTVWLRLQVLETGAVGEVQIKTSSGSRHLDAAAKTAVKRWKFAPARRSGQAVESWVNVPIRFNLN